MTKLLLIDRSKDQVIAIMDSDNPNEDAKRWCNQFTEGIEPVSFYFKDDKGYDMKAWSNGEHYLVAYRDACAVVA